MKTERIVSVIMGLAAAGGGGVAAYEANKPCDCIAYVQECSEDCEAREIRIRDFCLAKLEGARQ